MSIVAATLLVIVAVSTVTRLLATYAHAVKRSVLFTDFMIYQGRGHLEEIEAEFGEMPESGIWVVEIRPNTFYAFLWFVEIMTIVFALLGMTYGWTFVVPSMCLQLTKIASFVWIARRLL